MSKTFYLRNIGNPEFVCSAVIIPAKDEKQPYWVKYCKLTYSEDGKNVILHSEGGAFSGSVGEDILAWWGNNQFGTPMADIIPKGTEAYRGLEICDEYGDPVN